MYVCVNLVMNIYSTTPPLQSSNSSRKKRPRTSVVLNPPKLTRMMIKLWELIVDYKDSSGRQISAIFMVLPTRKELTQYYQIIKKPMDLKKIKVCSVVCSVPCVWLCIINNYGKAVSLAISSVPLTTSY